MKKRIGAVSAAMIEKAMVERVEISTATPAVPHNDFGVFVTEYFTDCVVHPVRNQIGGTD